MPSLNISPELMRLLVVFLTIAGLLYMVGAVMTFRRYLQERLMDRVLDALSPSTPEDPLTRRALLTGSILTFITGTHMLLYPASAWLSLTILVLSQLIYFRLKQRRYRNADTDEEKEESRVQATTMNAFRISLALWLLSLLVSAAR